MTNPQTLWTQGRIAYQVDMRISPEATATLKELAHQYRISVAGMAGRLVEAGLAQIRQQQP